MDKVINEIILKEYGAEETLVDICRRNSSRWFGHVERMKDERPAKQMYQGKAHGSAPRGRPRKEWLEYVNETHIRKGGAVWRNESVI